MFDAAIIDQLTNDASTHEHRPAPDVRLSGLWAGAPDVAGQAYVLPYLKQSLSESDRLFFDQWVDEWLADTHWQSSLSIITSHRRFSDIKRMGPTALKFVLGRLKAGDVQVHWFPLLHDLSGGFDPVPHDGHGVVPEMTKAWIQWGSDRGIIDAS